MSGGAGHHNNEGCLLSVCLGQKVYFNETRTGTVETNKAMGAVVGFMGKKENPIPSKSKNKENAERAEEDVVIPPPSESEEDMSPLAMVEKFEGAPVYLLVRMLHLIEKMREEHKYSCGIFEGFKIVPENMVIAVKLKRKKSKNDVVAWPRPVKELSAQQKNLSILQENERGAAAFFVNGLQDTCFITAASNQGLTVSKNATAFAVNK